MAASKKSDPNNEFFNLQQKYWNALVDAQKQFAEQAQSEGFQKQWEGFFKEWQATVFKDAPTDNGFSSYFAQSGKSFIDMMQTFYQATGEGQTPEEIAESWLTQMRDILSGIIEGKGTDGISMCDPMGFTNSMHTLGYHREQQEMFNEFINKWTAYVQKSNLYDREMAKVGLEAMQAFQEFVTNPPKDEAPLESMKDLYNKWVDVAEDIYAKYAVSEKYTKLYGDVVNALMDVKQAANKITDFFVGQMHLPTREEIDSVHKRVHDLRRENIQLKKDIAEIKAALGSKKTTSPKAKTPTKKKATTKPAVKKKATAKKTTAKKVTKKKTTTKKKGKK